MVSSIVSFSGRKVVTFKCEILPSKQFLSIIGTLKRQELEHLRNTWKGQETPPSMWMWQSVHCLGNCTASAWGRGRGQDSGPGRWCWVGSSGACFILLPVTCNSTCFIGLVWVKCENNARTLSTVFETQSVLWMLVVLVLVAINYFSKRMTIRSFRARYIGWQRRGLMGTGETRRR